MVEVDVVAHDLVAALEFGPVGRVQVDSRVPQRLSLVGGFAEIAVDMGVPREQIIVENRSTNTGENIMFTRQLLSDRQITPRKLILVQKPYMERRSYATFRKFWPEKELIVTSPQVSFHDYLADYANRNLSTADVVSIMVGDLQRIKLYPARGFQISQEIPDEVWEAFEGLVRAGYDRYLIN